MFIIVLFQVILINIFIYTSNIVFIFLLLELFVLSNFILMLFSRFGFKIIVL